MLLFELRQEVWDSSLVTTGYSGSLSCCLREVKSPFELRGERGIALESRQGNQASIRMEGGISKCFSSCGRKCGFPRVAKGTCGSLSCCLWEIRNSFEL